MEKQIDKFTFFDLYAEIMDTLTDEERGALLRAICEEMFTEAVRKELKDKKLIFLWGNIYDLLCVDKTARESGTTPKGLNRQMKHFTFYRNFYEAIELMDDKQAGLYGKALYNYALNEQEPSKLPSPVDTYYRLSKRKLALSKVRSKVGKKGGSTVNTPVTIEQINAVQLHGLTSIGIEEFLRRNPQIKNDIYNPSLHLTEGIDWTMLDDCLPISRYHDCKSLYKILMNYKEIISG